MVEWQSFARGKKVRRNDRSKAMDERWQPEAPTYRFENHPEDGYALVVEKRKGTNTVERVLGRHLRSVTNTEQNYRDLVEQGKGVVSGSHILHFHPLDEEECKRLKGLLNRRKKK